MRGTQLKRGEKRQGEGRRCTSYASDRLDDEFVEHAALSHHAAEQLDSSFQLGTTHAAAQTRTQFSSPRGRRCAGRLGGPGTLRETSALHTERAGRRWWLTDALPFAVLGIRRVVDLRVGELPAELFIERE